MTTLSNALSSRLARLEARAPTGAATEDWHAVEAQAAETRQFIRDLLVLCEEPLSARELSEPLVMPLEARSLGARLARVMAWTTSDLRAWLSS